MNLGWVVNLVSPSNPTAQVILITKDAAASVNPDLSVEVEEAVCATDPGIYHHLVGTRGWTHEAFHDWLARALARDLLD